MCGLVGVYGDLYVDHLKYFRQALIADYVRGKHSTGMTAVKASGDVFNKKLAIDPINFLDLKAVNDNILNTNTLIMGHNRHATLGGINAQNAHPFEHGNITLMHNGTLNNKVALQHQYDAPVFGTDSELVCWLLNEYDVATIIPKLEGAFALTWYDAGEDTFNFIRNDERPMAMALDGGTLLYASEWRMLGWIMERNRLVIKDFDVFEPKAGEHYKFSYDKKVITKEVTEIDLHVEPPYVASNYGKNYTNQYPATNNYVGGTM